MKPYKKFKPNQIRWAEKMGSDKDNPYLIRWAFLLFGFSIRIHHWIGSDEDGAYHDHPWNFTSILLRGSYTNVTPDGEIAVSAPGLWHSSYTDWHYLKIDPKGAWTILICGRPKHKWGFLVNGRKMRPLRYFHRKKGHAANTNALDNVKVF